MFALLPLRPPTPTPAGRVTPTPSSGPARVAEQVAGLPRPVLVVGLLLLLVVFYGLSRTVQVIRDVTGGWVSRTGENLRAMGDTVAVLTAWTVVGLAVGGWLLWWGFVHH